MIQSFISNLVTLTSNDASVVFDRDCIRTNSCKGNRSWLCHSEGSANFTVVEGGIYEVNYNATISSATAGVVAFALFNNGEMIPGTLMAETLAAAGDYANIAITKKVPVCCKGNSNISVRAVPTVPTATDPTTPITTQIPIIASANFFIDRDC